MEILSFISTRLATLFALKLFFTPIKFPIPRRELPIRDLAKEHELETGNSSFKVFEWQGTGKKVILVHGWSGRATQFFKIIEALTEKNYHVYAIEAPAHGDSDKKKTHMLEFVECIEITQNEFGPFDIGIGHSLGGMAIFNALLRNLEPHKIVVIGTPANIRNVVRDFCQKVKATEAVGNKIVETIESRYQLKVEDASTDTLAQQFNPEGLIIHDEYDQDIAVEDAKQLSTHWNKADLYITSGFGHRKVLMSEEVIEKILSFLIR